MARLPFELGWNPAVCWATASQQLADQSPWFASEIQPPKCKCTFNHATPLRAIKAIPSTDLWKTQTKTSCCCENNHVNICKTCKKSHHPEKTDPAILKPPTWKSIRIPLFKTQPTPGCPIFPSGRIESIDVVFPYGGLAHETFCLGPTRGNGKRVVESRKLKVFCCEALFCMCWRSTKNIYCAYPLVQIQVSCFFLQLRCWVFAFKLWWCPVMMNLGFQYLHVFTYRYPPNFPNVDRYVMHLSGPGCYWNKIITMTLLSK